MDRRKFLLSSAALSAAAFMPQSLFAKSTIENNRKRMPKALKPKITGGVKEFHLFIDIAEQEIVPDFKIHTLAFNNTIPGPEIRVQKGDKVRVYFKNKTELNHTIHCRLYVKSQVWARAVQYLYEI
jgi:FtsP/CotA-like multicopper oxidase with cupredoxin domain